MPPRLFHTVREHPVLVSVCTQLDLLEKWLLTRIISKILIIFKCTNMLLLKFNMTLPSFSISNAADFSALHTWMFKTQKTPFATFERLMLFLTHEKANKKNLTWRGERGDQVSQRSGVRMAVYPTWNWIWRLPPSRMMTLEPCLSPDCCMWGLVLWTFRISQGCILLFFDTHHVCVVFFFFNVF